MPELQDLGFGAADPWRGGRIVAVECEFDTLDAKSIAFAIAIALLSYALTWLAIRYAYRRLLLDLPGRRRSHSAPTPRGGGIAIVVAMLTAIVALPWFNRCFNPSGVTHVMIASITLVAVIGWIDDHRPLSARLRLFVHFLAAAIVIHSGIGAFAIGGSSGGISPPWTWTTTWVVWLAVVWSINLHNFMDGINGILSAQALFVFGSLALLALPGGSPLIFVLLPLVFAAAVLGFFPWNFPRARIFMGDVGSGVIGLSIAIAILLDAPASAMTTGLVLCSAFVTDATCTLLSRMLRGRRWYSAHREHLYQWLVRAGLSHAKVVALFTGWNLLVALPVVLWMNRTPQIRMSDVANPVSATFSALVVYALAVMVWCVGKRWCLRRVANGGRHAAA